MAIPTPVVSPGNTNAAPPVLIDRELCMGDSLQFINANTDYFNILTNNLQLSATSLLSVVNTLVNRTTRYVEITGVDSGGVTGTGDLASVSGLSYSSGYSTKSGSATYNISKLRGAGLNPATITSLHVVCDVRMYANDLARKANIWATYPDTKYRPILRTIIDAGIGLPVAASVATSLQTVCTIPVNRDTTTVSLSVQTDYAAHGEYASYQIIGATTF